MTGLARQTFRSLSTRNLRLYFAGMAVSMTGTWVQQVALAWLVLDLGGNGVDLGITIALQFAPVLVFGAFAGVIADRLDKLRVMLVTQSLAGGVAVLLGVLTLTGHATLAWVWILATALGFVTTVDNPARRGLITELVPAGDAQNAIGLNSAVMTTARVAGPALGGILIATAGIGWCFVVNAVSYLAVLVAAASMSRSEIHPAERVPRERGQVRAGLRYVWSTPSLRLPLVLIAVVSTTAFNYPVVLPLLARETFSGGATTYTVMYCVMSVGSLLGALGAAARQSSGPRFMVVSAAAFGGCTLLAASAPSLPLTIVALVPVGLTGVAFFTSATAEVQVNADPSMRGRVLALHAVVFLGSTPVGGPMLGWVTEAFGPRVGLGVGGVATLVAVAVAVRARRRHPLADLAAEWQARHRLAA